MIRSFKFFSQLLLIASFLALAACGGGSNNSVIDDDNDLAPVITLDGNAEITILEGDDYIALVATVIDDVDENLTITQTGTVNTAVVGTYTVTYTVTDTAGNTSSITATINVIPETTPPVISLNGNDSITLIQGDVFTDLGAVAVDNKDGTVAVTQTGTVDTATIGIYTLTYTAMDAAGNSNSKTRTINVIADAIGPVITLNGSASITLFLGNAYTDSGATAVDNKDGIVTVIQTGTVDTTTIGIYTLTYTAMDTAGNNNSKTRTINVIADAIGPVITLNGRTSITLILGDAYTDSGATAVDNKDGIVAVTQTGTVDTATIGIYTLTYTAMDAAKNTTTITRNVRVSLEAPLPFITTWSMGDNDNIIITTSPDYTYNFQVDWGDGQTSSNVTFGIAHIYATAGTYTITISGDFPQFLVGNDASKLLSVEQWGDNSWRSMKKAFQNAGNLVINATDIPRLSQVTDMSSMFSGIRNFNQDISAWDVSSVTDMSYMFYDAMAFNQDLSDWDVSSVTDMSYMFAMRYTFTYTRRFNQGLSTWDTSSVTDMSGMFSNAKAFNQDLSAWDVSSVLNMSQMFYGALAFNQNLSAWDVSSVNNMGRVFYEAEAFNQDLSVWDVSSATNMGGMFAYTRRFNQDLSAWDTSSVTHMAEMFTFARAFNQDLSTWDVSLVTNMRRMFFGTDNFNQDLSTWDTSSVTDMIGMFSHAGEFNQDLSTWDVSSVTEMSSMFSNAKRFNQELNAWNVSSVINMSRMFIGAETFNRDLSAWDVSSVTNMLGMFSNAGDFNQDLSTWDVSSVTNMLAMFSNAGDFNQDLSAWDTSSVTDMNGMFSNSKAFDQNLSNWDVSSVTNMSNMFKDVTLATINYDALLAGWSAQSLQSDVSFGAGNSEYTDEASKNMLVNIYGWTITDGGLQ